MVESKDLITIYFGKFETQYIGSPFMIGGNQIYSAIIRENGLDSIKSASKISHGIFHTIPKGASDWMGWKVDDKINLNEKTIKSYKDFLQLRSYHTPFIKDIPGKQKGINQGEYSDFNRIMRKQDVIIKSGEKIDIFAPDRLSFFIISNNSIDLNELSIGAKRNLGFGRFKITNEYSFNIDNLDYSKLSDDKKVIETAKNGIKGILNHQKYGYGEFSVENWSDRFLIRLMTPLCLSSSIEGSRNYDTVPDFMKGDVYRRHQETIWRKGHTEKLYCISDGSVFTYGI